tara:strand:+ start:473 stop:1069 length:597 start_codon:yes stop_codon:yes gene_type:complete
MINFKGKNNSEPLKEFKKFYKEALSKNQKNIEAIAISSFSSKMNEVDSRFVNLKFFIDENFIFFSNYNSPKGYQFTSHDQISALIFWSSINVQIRIKALIEKTPNDFSDKYFKNRDKNKNALAISSNQSQPVASFREIKKNYINVLSEGNTSKRPKYWGGYLCKPYSYEFWKGHKNRLNKRQLFFKNNSTWESKILQP